MELCIRLPDVFYIRDEPNSPTMAFPAFEGICSVQPSGKSTLNLKIYGDVGGGGGSIVAPAPPSLVEQIAPWVLGVWAPLRLFGEL